MLLFLPAAVRTTLTRCMSDADWRSFVASTLSIPEASVSARPASDSSSCASKRSAEAESFSSFVTEFTGTPSTTAETMQSSFIASADSSVVSSVEAAAVEPSLVGVGGIAVPVSAGLTAGIIAAIAVGSVAGAAAVGGVAYGLAKSRRRAAQNEPLQDAIDSGDMDYAPKPSAKKFDPALIGGVDMDPLLPANKSRHHSITARSPAL